MLDIYLPLFGAGLLALCAAALGAAIALLRRKKNNREEELEEEIDRILECISDGVVIYDEQMRLQRCNSSFREMYSLTAPALIRGATLRDILSFGVDAGQWPDATPRKEEWIRERLKVQSNTSEEMLTKVGEDRWVLVRNDLTPNGGTIGIRTDVTELETAKREAEAKSQDLVVLNKRLQAAIDEITFYANHDTLTGLLNRRYFENYISRLGNAERNRAQIRQLHIMHLDLDRFKHVNDRYGHAAGDAILKNSASIIEELAGHDDVVARVGGDEFALILHDARSKEDWLDFARELIRRISEPISFEGAELSVGASVGVAPAWAWANSVREAMKNADIALYQAKEDGRDCARYFAPGMAMAQDRLDAAQGELRDALRSGALTTFYQPQFDAQTLEVVGAEALVRWRHPDRGLLKPDDFLETAGQVALAATIDRYVFNQVCEDYEKMRARGLAPPKLSVNVAVQTLAEIAQWPEVDCAAVRDGVIALELLESIALDRPDDSHQYHIDALKELGFQIEIDDFGSDRASIVGLTLVRPSRLKIDERLVGPAPRSAAHAAVVKSILGMARALDIAVVAEGVETADHVQAMRELGCQALQGYALGRPAPFEEFYEALRGGLDLAPQRA